MLSLYRYSLPWKEGRREGLILQKGDRFSEIAPLQGFSKESLDEAEEETIRWIKQKNKPNLPSVRWGIECLNIQLQSIKLPLCALGPKKNFPYVKLKLGHLPLEDAINLVKRYVGTCKLRLDCNRAWDLQTAIEFTKHFSINDFEYLEEPLQSFDELIEFSKKTHFPIAVDESIHLDWNQIPSLKAIVVKPTVVGFIPNHSAVILSSAYESGLGLLHIAMRSKNPLPIGLDTYESLKDDILLNPIRCENGFFSWEKSEPLLKSRSLSCVL